MTGPVGQEGAEPASLPLAEYEQVRMRDVDEARALVASAFCGHQRLPIDGAAVQSTAFGAAQQLQRGAPAHPGRQPPIVFRNEVDIIEGHAAEPLTVEDVAEAVGIGVRALQQGFRRYLDTTPTNYLRDVWFRRVRAELAASDPTTTSVRPTFLGIRRQERSQQ